MEPTRTKPSRWRLFGSGLAGFFLAALAGVLAGYLFFRLGIYQWLIQLVPQDQPLIRLVAGILFSFLGVGLAGAVYGILTGATLHRIDPQGSRRRYMLAAHLPRITAIPDPAS
jgi:hypothetical protein